MTRSRHSWLAVAAGCAALLSAGAGPAQAAHHASRHAPRHVPRHAQVGVASYYGAHHAGKAMANGAPMSPRRMTAASRTLPLGARAKVTNLDTGKSVDVTVADRGPYAHDRIIDVSSQAARKLDMEQQGVASVRVTPLQIPKTAP